MLTRKYIKEINSITPLYSTSQTDIPANFFSVKCTRFFVSTESEFPKIYRRLLKIAEHFGRLPKIAEGSQRLLKITRGKERFSTTSKQSCQQFPKDFQPILSIIKKFRRCSDDFSNVEKQLTKSKNKSAFKQLHSSLSDRREKLV